VEFQTRLNPLIKLASVKWNDVIILCLLPSCGSAYQMCALIMWVLCWKTLTEDYHSVKLRPSNTPEVLMCGQPTLLRSLCAAIQHLTSLCAAIQHFWGPYVRPSNTLDVLMCGHPTLLRSLYAAIQHLTSLCAAKQHSWGPYVRPSNMPEALM
jgi:hypothetical protein